MEKILRPYDKECMKMAMLKHEETFKEQVYELHRLYRIQKMLMKSIQTNNRHNNFQHHVQQQSSRIQSLDLERPAEEFIDESAIELTLGPANYNSGRKKFPTPLTSDSGPSFSSSSTESRNVINRRNSGIHQGNDMRSKIRVDIEEQMKQPPWLLQVLSLNMSS